MPFPPEWRLSSPVAAGRDDVTESPVPGVRRTSPLGGCVVVDLSTWIGGGYCTKLLADGGAEIMKVEAPAGDPLAPVVGLGRSDRRRSRRRPLQLPGRVETQRRGRPDGPRPISGAPGAARGGRRRGVVAWIPLAEHATVCVRPLLGRPPAPDRDRHHPLRAGGSLERPSRRPSSPCRRGRAASSGWRRGLPDRAPVFVGGQIGEWLAGFFAAIGHLGGGRGGRAGRPGRGRLHARVPRDVPHLLPRHLHRSARPPVAPKRRFVPPGVGEANDGLVGLGCGTGQQWLDFCVMVGHPEWMEDRSLFLDRTALAPTIDPWIADHTVDEVLDLASAFRIPNAPIVNGANMTQPRPLRGPADVRGQPAGRLRCSRARPTG